MCQTCRRHHPELYVDKPEPKPKLPKVKKAAPKKAAKPAKKKVKGKK